jgi:hypothetical protein
MQQLMVMMMTSLKTFNQEVLNIKKDPQLWVFLFKLLSK